MLLVGRQEGHPIRKNPSIGMVLMLLWLEVGTNDMRMFLSSSYHHNHRYQPVTLTAYGVCLICLFFTGYSRLGSVPIGRPNNNALGSAVFLQAGCPICHPPTSVQSISVTSVTPRVVWHSGTGWPMLSANTGQ